MKIILILLFVTILLESTITTLPLTLLLILFSAVVFKENKIFALAFLAGLFLDILALRTIGFSSLMFTVVVLVVFLYEKKFEIDSLRFATILCLGATLSYLVIFGVRNPVLQAVISSAIFFLSFLTFKKTNKKALKYA